MQKWISAEVTTSLFLNFSQLKLTSLHWVMQLWCTVFVSHTNTHAQKYMESCNLDSVIETVMFVKTFIDNDRFPSLLGPNLNHHHIVPNQPKSKGNYRQVLRVYIFISELVVWHIQAHIKHMAFLQKFIVKKCTRKGDSGFILFSWEGSRRKNFMGWFRNWSSITTAFIHISGCHWGSLTSCWQSWDNVWVGREIIS